MEPEQLRCGKEFHKCVQSDWSGLIEDAKINHELCINLFGKEVKCTRRRKGRIDIFVNQLDDFVSVVEIKATNWDKVKKKNIKKLLGSHRRQVLKYVDKYLDVDQINVCAGIIYPYSPSTPGLKEKIETYLNNHSLQVLWYYDK